MTPRRSSGGPQCAFEENKKERERRAGERARELSPEKRAAGRCLAKPRWDRGATRRHFGGGGRGATSAAAAPEATQRCVGQAATSASVDCIFN